ncbi:LptA/OstA family protein [Consotaella aegiceratis]|uniref:LptA/OstA family protein n=1 Tax=Consotaella aegiceratis TaxID=3097961 RepID=UPI002F3FB896
MKRASFIHLGLTLFLAAAIVPVASAQTTSRFGGLQMSSDQPIAIESDQLDVDDAGATATFTGNVDVVQGETRLKTSKLVVFYSQSAANQTAGGEAAPSAGGQTLPGGNDDIERLKATGKVYLKTNGQIVTADEGDFNLKDQLVVMTGKEVVLTQGENVAVGCKLTVHTDTNIAQLDSSCGAPGRVKMMIGGQK